MTDSLAIELAGECGWEVMDRTDNGDGGAGVYKIWVPPAAGSHAVCYSAYIDTNREPFAEALLAVCRDYRTEDDTWRAGTAYQSADTDTKLAADRVRGTVDMTLAVIGPMMEES